MFHSDCISQVGSSTFHGDTMLASTQTAVILAELEVNASSSGDLDLTCSGFCPDSPVKVQVMNLPNKKS